MKKKKLKTQLEILGIEPIINMGPVTLEDLYGKEHLMKMLSKSLMLQHPKEPAVPSSLAHALAMAAQYLLPRERGRDIDLSDVPEFDAYPAPPLGVIDA